MSARLPSSSRLTIPISSVTLAWRTLVTTGNFWPSFQINGSLISRSGNISQSRVCCGESERVELAVFLRFVDGDISLSSRWLHGQSVHDLSAGNRRNDADFVALFQRRLLVLQKANVFLVDIHIHKPAHLALVIHQALFYSRIT